MQLATAEKLGFVGNLNQPTAERLLPATPRWRAEEMVAGKGSAYLAKWIGAGTPAPGAIEPPIQPPPRVFGLVLASGLVVSNLAIAAGAWFTRTELDTWPGTTTATFDAVWPGTTTTASFDMLMTGTKATTLQFEPSGVESAPFDETRSKLLPYLTLVRSLLERDEIALARYILDSVPLDLSAQPETRRLKRLLAPPRVTVSRTRDVDRAREYRWLRDHWQEYRGQWVALDGDRVVAAARSLKELRELLRTLHPAREPLIHHVR